MKVKKVELIISIMLIMGILIVGLGTSVFADDSDFSYIGWPTNSDSDNNLIESRNTNNSINEEKEIAVSNNTIENKSENDTANKNIANTGVEDLFGSKNATAFVIGACVISAVFAYKKIKEYNVD